MNIEDTIDKIEGCIGERDGTDVEKLAYVLTEYAESVLESLAAKLQSESEGQTLAISFDGDAWQVGDMYGYGVADRKGEDIASLIEYINEQ